MVGTAITSLTFLSFGTILPHGCINNLTLTDLRLMKAGFAFFEFPRKPPRMQFRSSKKVFKESISYFLDHRPAELRNSAVLLLMDYRVNFRFLVGD